jgi:hypothetical protein
MFKISSILYIKHFNIRTCDCFLAQRTHKPVERSVKQVAVYILWHSVSVTQWLFQLSIKYFATFNRSLVNAAHPLLPLNTQHAVQRCQELRTVAV